MIARIENHPCTFNYQVWLYATSPEGTTVFNVDGSVREEVAAGATPEPSLEIHEEILKALVESGSDVLPPSAATTKHLDDAIRVRDRLLTLVENGAQPK